MKNICVLCHFQIIMFKKEKHHFFKDIFFQIIENMCEEYNYGKYEEIFLEIFRVFGDILNDF